jgi:endonuclease YncB( thermonuclease family)
MAVDSHHRFLEEKNRSKFAEHLDHGAQDSNYKSSPTDRWTVAAGLGLSLIGAAFTKPGQKVLHHIAGKFASHKGPTDLERAAVERWRFRKNLRSDLLARERKNAVYSNLGQIGDETTRRVLRDAIVNTNEFHFLKSFKEPSRIMETIAKKNNLDLVKDNLTTHLEDALKLNRVQTTYIRETTQRHVDFMMDKYDEALLKKFKAFEGPGGINGLRHITLGDALNNRAGFNFSPDMGHLTYRGTIKNMGSNSFQENLLREMASKDSRFNDVVMQRGLLVNQENKIIDFTTPLDFLNRALKESGEFHFPFVGISPASFLGIDRIGEQSAMPIANRFNRESAQFIFGPNTPLGKGEYYGDMGAWLNRRDIMYIGGKVYSLDNQNFGEVLTEGVHLKPGRYGPTMKIYSNVSGVGTIEREERKGFFGAIADFMDLGLQEQYNVYERVASIWKKTKDESWDGNLIPRILKNEDPRKAVEEFRKYVGRERRSLSDEQFNQLFGEQLAGMGFDFNLSTEEGIMSAFESLATGRGGAVTAYQDEFAGMWNSYIRDPEKFMRQARSYSSKTPDILIGKYLGSSEIIPKTEDVKKLIQSELAAQILHSNNASADADQILMNLMNVPGATTDSIGLGLDLMLRDNPAEFIQDLLKNSPVFSSPANEFVRARTPWYSYGELAPNVEHLVAQNASDEFLLERNAVTPPFMGMLRSLNEGETAAGSMSGWGDFFKQFVAGRDNMEHFTSVSAMVYNFLGRINTGMSYFGLGLAPEHTGSIGNLAGNMFLRRYLPAIAGIGLLSYGSYAFGVITGTEGDEALANVGENAREGLAATRDRLGITGFFKHLQAISPGLEQVFELPGLNFFNPTMTQEEVKADVYDNDPVRKGRWWPMSNTPFIGGKVQYFFPGQVRQAYGDYKFTDSLYGSEQEYFNHFWLTNPIGHFITDPYWLEEKHYQDRPYPVTGPIPEIEGIPIVGPLASNLIGPIFKPVRPMHEDEIAQTASGLVQQQLTDINRGEIAAGSGHGGGYGVVNYGGIGTATDGDESYGDDNSEEVYGYIGASGQVEMRYDAGYYPQIEGRTNQGTGLGRKAVTRLNVGETVAGGNQSALINTNILLPAHPDREDYHPDMEGALMPDDISYAAARSYYGATEMAGLWGFMAQSVTGQPVENMRIIQDSGRMASYSRAFWDLNLGGLGGESSEIGRRFVPRQRRFDEDTEYNPIRNTMPTWLPGDDYFINFRTGDPYVKVERGEARLPGEGYEVMNNYNPMAMTVRSSQAGKTPEEITNYLLNIKEPLPEYVQEAMEEGTALHRMYQEKWKKEGRLLSMEEEVYDPVARVTGHYDAILQEWDGPRVVDIKTVSGKRFEQMEKQGHAYDEHMDQVTMYMHILGIHRAGIFYATREEDPKEKWVYFNYDEKRYQNIVNKLNAVRDNIARQMAAGRISRGDLYDPLHRFLILADVAPYSEEYRYYRDYVVAEYSDLTGSTGPERKEKEATKKLIAETKRQVSQMKLQHRFTPYRFKNTSLKHEKVHVTEVLNNGVFLTEEYPDNPIQFAGVKVPKSYKRKDVREYLQKYIHSGATVLIGTDRNQTERISRDSMQTMHAVVYAGGKNLNREMLRKGVANENEDDWSSPGVHARFNTGDRMWGSLWESFAHMDTPFHTKFLHVASPLEEYKRRDIYGKSFQQWSFKDQVIPTVQGIMAKNPLEAAAFGAMLGYLTYGRSRAKRLLGAKWGAAIGGSLAAVRLISEIGGQKWIPKRRQKEREINKYFDTLNYLKYTGLYHYAARKAKQEGFDVEKFYKNLNEKSRRTRGIRRRLEEEKHLLKIEDFKRRERKIDEYYESVERIKRRKDFSIKTVRWLRDTLDSGIEHFWGTVRDGLNAIDENRDEESRRIVSRMARFFSNIGTGSINWLAKHGIRHLREKYNEEQRKNTFSRHFHKNKRIQKINRTLESIGQNKELVKLTPWAQTAIWYKQQAESTLIGAKSSDFSKIMGAISPKEREYFTAFIKAKPEEREEILELVPENERRFLQTAWGQAQDRAKRPEEVLKGHYLPGSGWEGWGSGKNLEDVKVRVVKNEGLELSEFGFWKQDIARAEASEAPIMRVGKGEASVADLDRRIREIMEGAGLKDIDVQVIDVPESGINIDIDVDKDRRREIAGYINDNLDRLL